MTFADKVKRAEAVEKMKRDDIPVIIFGAGIVGEVLWQACRYAGLDVECFCDNNSNKARGGLCGIDIFHPLKVRAKYEDAVFLISAADMKDVVEQLQTMGYSKWHEGGLLLRDFDLTQCQYSTSNDFVEYAVSTCLLCQDSYLRPDKLFMRSVDIIITERCSLKCRDCSNLMQYYSNPRDCDIGEILQSLDMFCASVDEVNEIRVIGGEPFMNKEIYKVIERLIDEPKVRKIVIYTNGTIVPSEKQLEIMKNTKVLILMTNYGVLSGKLMELTRKLRQSNISHHVTDAQGWTACASLSRHNRSLTQLKQIFNDCCAKNTLTLSNGRLYRCPFAANADRLMAVPDLENDYVKVYQGARNSIEVKSRIRSLLIERKYLETCDFCNGRSFGAAEIEPAIQTGKPLKYQKCR